MRIEEIKKRQEELIDLINQLHQNNIKKINNDAPMITSNSSKV